MDALLTYLQKDYLRKLDGRLRPLLATYTIEDIAARMVSWIETGAADYYDLTTFARDFYIGSDLSEEEKDRYYSELKEQGFFRQLERFLYSDSLPVASWTIYTIGKFSEPENAGLMERAYETRYAGTNPILSYRCLLELRWLESVKLDRYLEGLRKDNALTARLVLLYYWAPQNGRSEFSALLQDKELLHLLVPPSATAHTEEEVSSRLAPFETYITELYANRGSIAMEEQEFLHHAKAFFALHP